MSLRYVFHFSETISTVNSPPNPLRFSRIFIRLGKVLKNPISVTSNVFSKGIYFLLQFPFKKENLAIFYSKRPLSKEAVSWWSIQTEAQETQNTKAIETEAEEKSFKAILFPISIINRFFESVSEAFV